jgi:hypothetical protein
VTLGLVSLLLAGCAAKPIDLTGAVATRTLPPVSDVIPADAARPPVSAKDDARVAMQRFAAWGDAEARSACAGPTQLWRSGSRRSSGEAMTGHARITAPIEEDAPVDAKDAALSRLIAAMMKLADLGSDPRVRHCRRRLYGQPFQSSAAKIRSISQSAVERGAEKNNRQDLEIVAVRTRLEKLESFVGDIRADLREMNVTLRYLARDAGDAGEAVGDRVWQVQ